MILSDEEAKAAQEVAKVTGKALDVASGAGTVLVKGTVERIAAATLGLVGGDWVQEQQKRNLARMQDKTARILDGIDKARLSDPSPSVVKPLLEAAADESREELQDLWAALLANSMVDGGKRVRRDYFDAVRQMEPSDALLLDVIERARRQTDADYCEGFVIIDAIREKAIFAFIDKEAARHGLSANETAIAVTSLTKLSCLIGPTGSQAPRLLPFGRGLLDACYVQ